MVRNASIGDLPLIEEIYSEARQRMAEGGNPTQWGTLYPGRSMLLDDISRSSLYAVERNGRIEGVFYFAVTDDETYRRISGAWHREGEYGVIHRIAAAPGCHGIFREALGYATGRIGYIRIDTHRDNRAMRSAVTGAGFRECGIIWTYDGSERIAYDCVFPVKLVDQG